MANYYFDDPSAILLETIPAPEEVRPFLDAAYDNTDSFDSKLGNWAEYIFTEFVPQTDSFVEGESIDGSHGPVKAWTEWGLMREHVFEVKAKHEDNAHQPFRFSITNMTNLREFGGWAIMAVYSNGSFTYKGIFIPQNRHSHRASNMTSHPGYVFTKERRDAMKRLGLKRARN